MPKEQESKMSKRFRDERAEMKALTQVAEDAGEQTWVYCSACRRAMRQGDCVVTDDGSLHCAYDDCTPEGNLAYKSLYGWDAYRLAHGVETAHWPEEPSLGDCYEATGVGP
jgi:hypothetical protein